MSRLPLRVALVADLAEERWPSMDLVADMLYQQLTASSHASMFQVELLRPTLTARGQRVGRYVNRFWDYSRWLRHRRRDFDVFHVIDHSYAHLVHVLPAQRTIVTCHDVDAFMPLIDSAVIPTRLPRTLTRFVLSGMRKAACITCDSRATRDEIEALDLAQPDRLVVIPNGVHPAMTATPLPVAADIQVAGGAGDLERMIGAREDGSLEILHVGTCIPRKRVDVLLRVVAAIRDLRPSVRLLKAGGQLTVEQKALASSLGLDRHIVQLPYLQSETLSALYRRADVVLVTSEREGFGLPVVEALACGTSVVASDLPVLREVGGDVVRYVPLEHIEAWRDTVLQVADEQERCTSREACARARTSHASNFSWAAAASALAAVYQRVGVKAHIV